MKYRIIFPVIFIISSFLGIFVAILNNNIIDEPQITNKKNIPPQKKEEEKTPSKQNEKNKNKIINDNDFLNEENENDEKKKQNSDESKKDINDEKEKQNSDENTEEKKKEKNDEEKIKNNNEYNKENNEQTKKEIKNKSNQGRNNIHLALNLDNKYIYPCIVFLTSLLENRANETFYIIHAMVSKNLKKEYFPKINKVIDKYGKHASNITYYNMGDDFKGAITGSHISTAAYYRIALPSLVPYVDRIIYTDVDVIDFVDLTEMYNIEFENKSYFAGTLDQIGLLGELKSLKVFTKKYMNSGILVMNLKGMRENGIEQKIRNYIFSHYLDHHDQTAINAVCYDNWQILSLKYAILDFGTFKDLVTWNNKQDKLYRYNDLEMNLAFYSPTLLHYAGWTKPWDQGLKKCNAEYWWYFAKMSDFYQEILKHYKFDEKKIEELIKKIPKDGGLLKRNYKKLKN